MLESELFALFENTVDAAYSVTGDGEICSWNSAAERLFGYAGSEVIGRDVDDVFGARDDLGTRALAGGAEAATRKRGDKADGIATFDLEVSHKNGKRMWINVSTIVFENRRTGRTLFMRTARDVSHHREKEELLARMRGAAREIISLTDGAVDHAPVEALSEQERRILTMFAQGANPAAIAQKLSISAQTLRNHLHRINRKLRTHNRLEAVTHARRRGLID